MIGGVLSTTMFVRVVVNVLPALSLTVSVIVYVPSGIWPLIGAGLLIVSHEQVQGNDATGPPLTDWQSWLIAIAGLPSLTTLIVTLLTPEPLSLLVPLNGGALTLPANGPIGVGSIVPLGAVVSTLITSAGASGAPMQVALVSVDTVEQLSTLSRTLMRYW